MLTTSTQSKTDRGAGTQSQLSMTSSASSSQSHLGILGHASKFVSSVLGGGKKAKPEVKSLQLAAAAAKKVCSWSNLRCLRIFVHSTA